MLRINENNAFRTARVSGGLLPTVLSQFPHGTVEVPNQRDVPIVGNLQSEQGERIVSLVLRRNGIVYEADIDQDNRTITLTADTDGAYFNGDIIELVTSDGTEGIVFYVPPHEGNAGPGMHLRFQYPQYPTWHHSTGFRNGDTVWVQESDIVYTLVINEPDCARILSLVMMRNGVSYAGVIDYSGPGNPTITFTASMDGAYFSGDIIELVTSDGTEGIVFYVPPHEGNVGPGLHLRFQYPQYPTWHHSAGFRNGDTVWAQGSSVVYTLVIA